MKILQAIKKAASFVAKELRGKVSWVWEKQTWFLPSARILKEKWWGRPTAVILAAISMMAFLGLAAPAFAELGTGYVYPAFAYLLEAISALIGQLLLWAIDLLIQISKYNSFLDANVVSIGWVLVRDVANMFFILIMLVIAFGTMLKIEAYSWKKLLPRLILTALLVNFSKTFIGLLIDFSQVIMLTFVNGYAAAAGGNFLSMFKIKELFSSSQNIDSTKEGPVSFQVLMGFALGTIMLGISLIVILVFVAILIFRIIILWILIVLSPLAFLLGTFPKGQEYYGQWWKQLQGQIIVGPMVAFFLWLSLAALGGGANNEQIKYSSTSSQDLTTYEASKPTLGTGTQIDWDNLASFAVSIAMLLMSLQMISQLGVAGAGLASGALSTIKSKATGLAKKLAVPVALGVATGGVGTGLMATGGWLGAKKLGGEAKEGIKEWWGIKKQEIKTGALERAKEGKFAFGIGAYSSYKMKMRQRKEFAEEREKKILEPEIARGKDIKRAQEAGLTKEQIKSGVRVSDEEAMVQEAQGKERQARIGQGLSTAAEINARGLKLQAAYHEAEKNKDEVSQSKLRQAILDLAGFSTEGHSIDDAIGDEKGEVTRSDGTKVSSKTVEGKIEFLKQMGMLDDPKMAQQMERLFQNMNKSAHVDYKNFDEISKNKDKTTPELISLIKDKQRFAVGNLTDAQLLQQHADTVSHGEHKDVFKERIMKADQRSLSNMDKRHAGAVALGINNIGLSPDGMAWDKMRQNEGGAVFRLPEPQFSEMKAAMKDRNKQEAVNAYLRKLGIEDKAETKIVKSTWNKVTEKWVDDASTETTLGKESLPGKYKPEKTPMEQVREMASMINAKDAPSRREEAIFRNKTNKTDDDVRGKPVPLPDIEPKPGDTPAEVEAKGAAQEIRNAAITFGATIDKAGIALKQRLNVLQASDPTNPSINPLLRELNGLLKKNNKGLMEDQKEQEKVVENLARLGEDTKDLESST